MNNGELPWVSVVQGLRLNISFERSDGAICCDYSYENILRYRIFTGTATETRRPAMAVGSTERRLGSTERRLGSTRVSRFLRDLRPTSAEPRRDTGRGGMKSTNGGATSAGWDWSCPDSHKDGVPRRGGSVWSCDCKAALKSERDPMPTGDLRSKASAFLAMRR